MASEMNGLFSEQAKERLEATYQYRQKILEKAFEEGDVPTDPKEIEAINNVLNSIDKSIYDRATADLKYQDSQNKEAVIQMVATTLKNVQQQKLKHQNDEVITDIGEDKIPLDLVKDELRIGVDQIALSEILDDEE